MISADIIKAVQEALEVFAVVVELFFDNLSLWDLGIAIVFSRVFVILNIIFKIREGFRYARF